MRSLAKLGQICGRLVNPFSLHEQIYQSSRQTDGHTNKQTDKQRIQTKRQTLDTYETPSFLTNEVKKRIDSDEKTESKKKKKLRTKEEEKGTKLLL